MVVVAVGNLHPALLLTGDDSHVGMEEVFPVMTMNVSEAVREGDTTHSHGEIPHLEELTATESGTLTPGAVGEMAPLGPDVESGEKCVPLSPNANNDVVCASGTTPENVKLGVELEDGLTAAPCVGETLRRAARNNITDK